MLHGQTFSHEFLKNRIVFEIDYGSIRHAEDASSALAGLNSPVDAQPAPSPTHPNAANVGHRMQTTHRTAGQERPWYRDFLGQLGRN